jgi:hypothetical protein
MLHRPPEARGVFGAKVSRPNIAEQNGISGQAEDVTALE